MSLSFVHYCLIFRVWNLKYFIILLKVHSSEDRMYALTLHSRLYSFTVFFALNRFECTLQQCLHRCWKFTNNNNNNRSNVLGQFSPYLPQRKDVQIRSSRGILKYPWRNGLYSVPHRFVQKTAWYATVVGVNRTAKEQNWFVYLKSHTHIRFFGIGWSTVLCYMGCNWDGSLQNITYHARFCTSNLFRYISLNGQSMHD